MGRNMAKERKYAVENSLVQASTESLDNEARSRGRERNSNVTSGKGVDAVTRLVGSNNTRKRNEDRDIKKRARLLEHPIKLRGIGRNFKNWKGKLRNEKLTEGERFWVERMRNGWDQHIAAQKKDMSRWQYQQKEQSGENIEKMKLAPFEWCRIMRRRVGWSQEEVARKMNTTRVWVHRMENGYENCDPLIWFWEQ